MRGVKDEILDGDIDVELFAQFPAKRDVVRLVGVDFASGKLPHTGEVHAGNPAGHEKPSVLFDHRGDDRKDGDGHERPTGTSIANLTRSASCPGVKGFCSNGIVPQKLP